MSSRSAADTLALYSTGEMRFTPAVPPPSVVKKRARRAGPGGGDSEWLAAQEAAATAPEGERLDFAALLVSR